ncbi:cytochrome P450 4V2-like isoform X1 [Montipora capricornis]|uniref:cytochrome P450 4V2-like isoform X1 n=1 Tax=Montipora capricornis TaxID=246305 RepID=UPI0035F20541
MVFVAILLTLVVVLIALGITTLLEKHHSLAEFRKLPGPRPNFLFGNAWELPTHPEGMLTQVLKWANDYRSVGFYCLWLGPAYPYLLTFKPELAEVVLNSSKHTIKSGDYSYLIPWLGTGLLLSDGSKWRARRKLITPTFHFRILNDFIQVFEEQAVILVQSLKRKASKGVFNIMPYISLCTLDIICITSMDSSPNAQENCSSPYVNAVLRISGLIHKRQRSPWLWNDILYSWTTSGREHDKCLKIIHGFMNKGHDTTAAGITWALYCLGRYPEMQQKVHEEVDHFFEQRPDTLTVDDFKDLRYLECVIKEALRLFPSVPHFARTTLEDSVLGGYFVPKGSTVGVSPIALHRNPDVWPSPLEFEPDRFLPENSQVRHPFAFLPFSAGPRNCIGQRFALLEEKVVLCHIMRNFNIESKQTFDELLPCGELITRPKEGIFVTLEERERQI